MLKDDKQIKLNPSGVFLGKATPKTFNDLVNRHLFMQSKAPTFIPCIVCGKPTPLFSIFMTADPSYYCALYHICFDCTNMDKSKLEQVLDKIRLICKKGYNFLSQPRPFRSIIELIDIEQRY